MALWTITLLAAAPASRTVPDGDRLHLFPAGKPIPHCSDKIAERCKGINRVYGDVFKIVEESPVAPVEKETSAVAVPFVSKQVGTAATESVILKKVTPVKQERKKNTPPKKATKPSKPIRLKTH